MAERRQFKYPPFFRLIRVQIKHRSEQVTLSASNAMAHRLRVVFGSRVLGPDNPPVGRVQNKYIKQILLKVEANASIKEAKGLLAKTSKEILSLECYKGIQVALDVDPM
jgi:primosomal protein N' (replication factor Y)